MPILYGTNLSLETCVLNLNVTCNKMYGIQLILGYNVPSLITCERYQLHCAYCMHKLTFTNDTSILSVSTAVVP